uniref:Uncharacterized protein n=1 Tax=Strongyloides papillosus TaxID=174720 RepID=A0A0N5BWM2_STREA
MDNGNILKDNCSVNDNVIEFNCGDLKLISGRPFESENFVKEFSNEFESNIKSIARNDPHKFTDKTFFEEKSELNKWIV